jgi:putative PIN family toxin of toxin-antitoxin system
MLNIVLDTNVLISALWTPGGNAARIVNMVRFNLAQPCYSAAIMEEYTEVLNRPKFDFPNGAVRSLLSGITRLGIEVEPEASTVPFIDETDRKFYDVANAGSAILITGNIKHFPVEAGIMTPAEFLDKLDKA